MLRAVEIEFLQPEVLPDAMIDVNDEFAGLQVGPIRDALADMPRRPFAAGMQIVPAAQLLTAAVDVVLRHNCEPRRR